METPLVCPLCTLSVTQVRKESHVDKGTTYDLFHCSSCGGEYWLPLKNPGAEWYAHDDRYAGRNADPHTRPNENHRRTMEFLRDKKPGRVLDIGCGTGNFLLLAEQKGWEGWGIDFDPDAILAAKTTNKLSRVSVDDLSSFAKKHGDVRFDLITFFDVFEHIDDHNEFINIVRNLLTEQGYVAMSMPYRHGARWLMQADLPPRHLTRWDRTSLSTYLAAHGFHTVFSERRTEGMRLLILKLRFRFGGLVSFGLVQKVKQASASTAPHSQSSAKKAVRAAEVVAMLKDGILFGLPALVIWLLMLPLKSRYVTLLAIARKETE